MAMTNSERLQHMGSACTAARSPSEHCNSRDDAVAGSHAHAIAYNSVISACANGGQAAAAEQFPEAMKSQELTPRVTAYSWRGFGARGAPLS